MAYETKQAFPPGHYYSALPDLADLQSRADALWQRRDLPPGLDFQVDSQLALLGSLKQYVGNIQYPVEATNDPTQYFYANGMYPALDAEFLYAFLSYTRPRRVVEVGSGFSSLVMADASRREMGGAMSLTCIEPYPRDFLVAGVPGITTLVAERAETVGLGFFSSLQAGDVLFIDSSHVSKTGSDVNFLYLEVLPRLNAGVYVHVHDIFLPDEYPQPWVMDEGRAWNEQYLLHAFLLFNRMVRVVWSAHYMHTRFADAVHQVFPNAATLGGGGGFWMQRL
jgi:predicted O-methyltransferase YrrM